MSIITKDKFYTLEKIYPISMSEQDMLFRIKPAALLNLLQDMGARNIDSTPFGRQELLKQGLGWFLVRYRIEFDNYPKNIYEIRLKTENRGTFKQTAFRDFEGYNLKGERLLRATSSWMMVDLVNKSLVNIEQKFPDITKFQKRDDDLQLQKLKPLSNWNIQRNFQVRYEDLDMNGHVNNTVYITWAMEALDYDFLSTNTIKNIDIYFKHEVKYGQTIVSTANLDGKCSYHNLKLEQSGEEVCLIKIEYE